MPSDVEKRKNVAHHRLRMQDELLIEHRQTSTGADPQTLIVHVLHCSVPLLQTTAEIVQVEARDCHLHRSQGTATL